MRRALSLAMRGMGLTSPDPMVGCVLVRDGRIIGEGWHRRFGSPHAEPEALMDAARRGEDPRGATAYVTLEPCCHWGKTPPCAQRLVREGVSRVVAATVDPFPKVRGGGLDVLREAGLDVTVPCLEDEARWIARGFFHVHERGRPWVTLKAAVGLDGRMALRDGTSKWITGPDARAWAHVMRASHDALLVGVGTVLRDDPALTVRDAEGRDPLRVVLDTRLRTPPGAKVVRGEGGCLILTASEDGGKIGALADAGADVVSLPTCDGRVDLEAALTHLANRGVLTLMVEGGPRVLSTFIDCGLADQLSLFVAPRILGEGPGLGTGLALSSVADAFGLERTTTRRIGRDILLEGRFTCSQGS